MHTLTDLLNTLRAEKAMVPVYNLALKQAIGQAVVMTLRLMIATSSGPWAPLMQSTIDYKTYHQQGFEGNAASPYYATGDFYRDVGFTVEGPVISIGTNLPYIEFVEMGSAHQAPRPIFRPAFMAAAPGIDALVKQLYLRSLK
jgi:hypothetical protein